MDEIWKPIKNYEDKYEVSNLGRVRSLRLMHGCTNRVRLIPKIMRQKIASGYYRVGFSKKKVETFSIHRLVLEAFIGPCPDGTEGSHLDGNRLNNRADNLIWESRAKNQERRKLHGTHIFGSMVSHAKLNETKVSRIKQMLSLKIKGRVIAAKFGVCPGLISRINRGKCWNHVAQIKEVQPK